MSNDVVETARAAPREDDSRDAARVVPDAARVTSLVDATIRATVLRHALLSYVFGTAIIASTIDVLAGLVG